MLHCTRHLVPALIVSALGLAPTHAMEFKAEGLTIHIPAGKVKAAGQSVEIKQPVTLKISPVPNVAVQDEVLKLSKDKPAGFSKGTKLRGCNARDVNARGSFVPGTLKIVPLAGGEPLVEGQDYLVDADWGHVGIGPQSKVTPEDSVKASYQYSLLRLDTIQVTPAGEAQIKTGKPHISAPLPPEADPGCVAVAHVFLDYRATAITQDHLYPILEKPAEAITGTTRGHLPKTLSKLTKGEPVKIVCLGDSVTAGGNASKPEFRYVDVFAKGLRERFPQAKIEVENISAGGSNSRQWLYPEKFPYRGLHGKENPARFERVVEAKPDLLTIEFVNDAGMNAAQVDEAYGEILKRMAPLGTEVMLITPHFTMWKMMGFQGMREQERRPYVLALRAFAEKHQLATADAAARWEHLWKEGLPYMTLLDNTINHPDDRGHRLFAEEMWKCFESGTP